MASLFDAVYLAKRSLMAHQWAMMTSSHNVANVNTPGYTRQRAELEPFTPPLEVPGGFIGMGTDVGEITRLRNRYLDRQVLAERENQGFLDFENTALSQVETILGETSGYGLSGILDEFWTSWATSCSRRRAARYKICAVNCSARSRLPASTKGIPHAIQAVSEPLTCLGVNLLAHCPASMSAQLHSTTTARTG